MLVATLLLMSLLTAYGYYFSRDLFAPFVVAPGVWCFILLLYVIMPGSLYPIQNHFPICLSVWMLCFVVISMIVSSSVAPSSDNSCKAQPNKWVLRAYVTVSIIFVPIMLYVLIKQAFLEDPENMFRYLRVMNTGADENIEMPNFGVLNYVVSLCYVTLFFVMIYFKNKKVIAAIVILNILLALVTMAKTNFLCVFLTSFYILYHRNIIKKKHMAYGGIGFVLFAFVLQSFRMGTNSSGEVEAVDTNDFFTMYLLTSIVAFDYYTIPFSAPSFGANSLRFLYAVGHSLGLSEEPVDTILPFVGVPSFTNTYTTMYPFYTDFGIYGLVIFAAIYAVIYGFLYKKMQTGGQMALILYAILLNFLVLEFIGEFIFTNLSLQIQYLFYAVVPFLLSVQISGKKTN